MYIVQMIFRENNATIRNCFIAKFYEDCSFSYNDDLADALIFHHKPSAHLAAFVSRIGENRARVIDLNALAISENIYKIGAEE